MLYTYLPINDKQDSSSNYRNKRIKEELDLANIPYQEVTPEDIKSILFTDKDIFLSLNMNLISPVKQLNNPEASIIAADKYLTYLKLKNRIINIETSLLPLDFEEYPIQVVKPRQGSMGNNIKLLTTKEEAYYYLNLYGANNCPAIVQPYMDAHPGESIRVICIKGTPIGAIKLHNAEDFRSNAALGGVGTVYELNDFTGMYVQHIAAMLGLDYCGLDFLIDSFGNLRFLEANPCAQFKTFEKTTNINVAKHIIDSILERNNYHDITRK